ncbi:PhzF family phenazine biosynthesis protein [Eisenibacter elegans]|uniref:PhzF family phenazine biosynthesis protein n=1 Tax=Eisenibacter elegans TaxID=997 RepID=UPI00054EF66B|nr:PhzF family phenazine biosynthesis protein [Eisenibacter elegans]
MHKTLQIPIYQVDAFSNTVFGGNPAAVCPLDAWLPDSVLQKIAAENNLSETAFVVAQGEGVYALRWFTPIAEVTLCGHATLATAFALRYWQHSHADILHFDTLSGRLTVQVAPDGWYWLDFPADTPTPASVPMVLEEALGIVIDKVWKGQSDYMVRVADAATLRALKPDFRQLAKLEARGCIITAKADGHTPEADFVSRCFYPALGIDEDPVTGSAHTLLVPYWANELQKSKLQAVQISTRAGHLHCVWEAGQRVQLAGQAAPYLAGVLTVPID